MLQIWKLPHSLYVNLVVFSKKLHHNTHNRQLQNTTRRSSVPKPYLLQLDLDGRGGNFVTLNIK